MMSIALLAAAVAAKLFLALAS